MKKIIFTLFLLVFWVSLSYAQPPFLGFLGSTVASGGACDTTVFEPTGTAEDIELGYNNDIVAGEFEPDTTGSICGAVVSGTELGTGPSQSWHLEIWTINTTPDPDEPLAQLGGDSDSFDPGDFPANPSFGDISVSWSSNYPPVSTGTDYLVLAVSNNTDGDFSNHYEIERANSTTTELIIESEDSGSSWAAVSTSRTLNITINQ